MNPINAEAKTCANTRPNVCDKVKANSSLLAEANIMLHRLLELIEGSAPCCDAATPPEPECLLDDVCRQHDQLNEMHITIRRIQAVMNG